MTAQLPVRQLIYTNVEVEDSPTHQRGFQIWQWSENLTSEQRRQIAKKLEDFRLPPGISGGEGRGLVRHVFCRLAEGMNLIGRTVPLEERDKFGRGGRFFAHAVLLTDEQFDSIGLNPFRIIDGGFPFKGHPHEIKAASVGEQQWKKGVLPDGFLTLTEANSVGHFVPEFRLEQNIFGAILAHIDRPTADPLYSLKSRTWC